MSTRALNPNHYPAAGKGRHLWTVLALMPFVLVLLYLFIFSTVPVPIYDDWEMVPLLQKGGEGTLGFTDFWAQHNEHRPVVPRLISYVMARASNWDVRWELALNFVLGVSLVSVVCLRLWPIISGLHALLFLIIGLMLSPSQWQNWMLGWQLQLWLCLLCGIFSLIISSNSPRDWRVQLLALILCLVSVLSFAAGLIFLLLVCLSIVFQRRCSIMSVIVCILFPLILGLYLYNLDLVVQDSPETRPINFLLYSLVWLGQPITPWSSISAGIAGAGGLLAATTLFAGSRFRSVLKPHSRLLCGLAAFSLISALLAAWSRAGFGVDQALSSRYITLANPFWVALFVAVGVCVQKRGGNRLGMLLALVAAMLVGSGYLYGIYKWDERHDAYRLAADALVAGEDTPALRFLYPNLETLAERRAYLEANHLSVFR